MQTNRQTTQTAAEAYAARRAQIEQQIADLQQYLIDHERRQKADPRNWGFAGDLANVSAHLNSIFNID
jgi:hypothetical protein